MIYHISLHLITTIVISNEADHPHRLNLHEVKIGQEVKEEVLRVQADRARPQMRPHQRLSKAGPKERTTFSVASRQRVAITITALMEAFTLARHIMERLVGTVIRAAATVFSLKRMGI